MNMTTDQIKENTLKAIKEKAYLGDGVYVHHDGYKIILTTPREDGEHYIALEPEVLEALDRYNTRACMLIDSYNALVGAGK